MDKILAAQVNPCLNDFKEQVEILIQKDREVIDLATYLQDSNSIRYSGEDQQAFIKTNITRFPQIMSRHIQVPKSRYKIGYLSAINRVWLSIGCFLYLWDTTTDDDVFRYECHDSIENVDLISFSMTHQEIVVSTDKEVYLHRLDLEGEKLKIVSNVSVHSSGVIMSNIVTTDTKRVFMKGDDGHLYELNILCDTNGTIVQCKLHCHTFNALLYYLPSIFKSAPESPLISIVLDNEAKLLYMLLADSSIHLVSVQGSQYLPLARYKGSKLESIHLISSSESKQLDLMAVANNGDRYYFTYQKPDILYKYKRQAPPLPGSLLFNSLSNEKTEISFYHPGVFIASLCKSESKFLVLTMANAIETSESQHIIIEDVYHESFSKKIWCIMENSSPQANTYHLKTTMESPDSPKRQFSILTEDGFTQYTKQCPVNQLEQVLRSGNRGLLLDFMKRYGYVETSYLGFVLACANQLPEAIEFLPTSDSRDDGLLLYFVRLVEGIWNMDVKPKSIYRDQLQSAQKKLETLVKTITQAQIPAKAEVLELSTRLIESISFVIFFHDLEWEETLSSIPMWNRTYTLADLVTTQDGATLSQEIILAALAKIKLSNVSNGFNFTSNFLNDKCLSFIGQENVIYYKGIECIYGARNNPNYKQQALDFALHHFTQIISNLDIMRITSLAKELCTLGDHYGAIKLAFAKYEQDTTMFLDVRPIITTAIEKALLSSTDKEYVKQVVTKALHLSYEDLYHFYIYNWLKDNNYKDLLIGLETPLLVRYIKTQLIVETESLGYLEEYYAYRKQYNLAIDCLYQLAMFVNKISVEDRVGYLNKACDYVALSGEEFENVKLALRVAKIQQNVCKALLQQKDSAKAKQSAEALSDRLVPAEDLFNQAYTHALHEQALYLMDVMDKYDFRYAESAWTSIIENCHDQERIRSKIVESAKHLYPSISSFPVYIVFKILHKYDNKFGEDFAFSTLVEAGVPREVVSDAKSVIVSH